MTTGPIVVFLGPSLSREDAEALLPGGVFLPPARQGDVYRAVRAHRPARIGLIDGVFLNVPAVWHRELLWALAQGIAVFGAASMGALRAAELAAFGMVGVGKIHAAFRDGRYPPFEDMFEDDDEVAIAHGPSELGSMPVSDAMVDIRETLALAQAEGLLDRVERDGLASALKRLHFSERSFARLADAARDVLTADRAGAFSAWLDGHALSQKGRDAAELLRRIAAEERAAAPPIPVRLEPALVWERFVAAEQDAEASAEEEVVLAELGLDPQAFRDVAIAAMGRVDLGRASAGLPASEALARFRRRRGLASRASIEAWLETNALDAGDLPRIVAGESAADEGLAAVPLRHLRRAVLDELRLTDRYAALAERARRKADATGARRALPAAPVLDGALSWYFERRVGTPVPKSLDAHASSTGFSSADGFRAAVWLEFLYGNPST